MINDKNKNEYWQALHYCGEHDGGFVHYYYRLNCLVDTEVEKYNRTYKIGFQDVMILQYLIGYQKKKNTCCFEKYETIMKRLYIKRGTLLDSFIKWRALGFIGDKKVAGRNCHVYVDIPYLMEYLGYTESEQKEMSKQYEKEQNERVEESTNYKPSYDDDMTAEEMF
jgi:hypothetical protein